MFTSPLTEISQKLEEKSNVSTITHFGAFPTFLRPGLFGLVFVGESNKSEERLMVVEGDMK